MTERAELPGTVLLALVTVGLVSGCYRPTHGPPPYTPYHHQAPPAWPDPPARHSPAPAVVPRPQPPMPMPPPAATVAPTPPPLVTRGQPNQRGRASYYHDSLAGNHTANGDIYDPLEMTAAHRKLPFGTIVDVVRPNGRYVRVRINDRGPFAGKNRIIDLSRIAAERLGMIRAGVVEVSLYIIHRPGSP